MYQPVVWMTPNLMGVKPGDSSVVIGYKVDEFIHITNLPQVHGQGVNFSLLPT